MSIGARVRDGSREAGVDRPLAMPASAEPLKQKTCRD
jgi:hypothetical protein